MKRLLLLMLLSLVGTSVSAAEDCFDRIAQKKGLDADLLRAIAFVESSGNPSALLMLLSLVGTSVSAAEDCFDRIAQKKGLDADLLRAIAFVESSGNPSAVGRNASSEDYGLMQAEDCFDRIAQKKGLDADLLRAIAFVESSGNPSAVGRNASSEDYGLMQINSGWLKRFKTSKSELLNDACKRFKTSKSELLNDACFNVQVGAEILADNFTRTAHPWDAVGAYNAACTRLKGQDCIDARQKYAWKVYRAYIGMSDAKRQKLRDVTS